MGSWGYMPGNDDGAYDLLGELAHEAIYPYLEKLFEKPIKGRVYAYWSRLGLVQHLLDQGYDMPRKVVEQCLVALRLLQADECWIGGFRNPSYARSTIADMVRAFEAVLEKEQARHDAWSKARKSKRTPYGRTRRVCPELRDEIKVVHRKARLRLTLTRKAQRAQRAGVMARKRRRVARKRKVATTA